MLNVRRYAECSSPQPCRIKLSWADAISWSLVELRLLLPKARLSWERFIQIADRFFPPIKVLHPLPVHRFDARTRGRSSVR
jgi:hypothetical protein